MPYVKTKKRARKTSNLLGIYKKYRKGAVASVQRLQPEPKWVNSLYNQLNVVGGAVTYLNSTAQGAGAPGARVGDRIRSLYVVYDIWVKPPTNGSADIALVSIIVDSQNSAVAPVYGDIYETGGGVTCGFCLRNVAKLKRFTVIKSFSTASIAIQTSMEKSHFRGLARIPARCSAVTYDTGAATPIINAVMATFSCANNTAAALTSCTFIGNFRYVYNDA